MLMTVAKLKTYISTDLSDQVLEDKLQALETMIRSYTHNNFQNRSIRSKCSTDGSVISGVHEYIHVGDTIEISNSIYNNGLHVVQTISGGIATVTGSLFPEEKFFVAKILYPADVLSGVVNLIKWDLNNGDKVGVQSETISRHSKTYFNFADGNSIGGFPAFLMGFLEPYRKARF